MKILLIVIMFFAVTALLIISNNNLAMIKDENIQNFSELYVEWVDQVYSNFQVLTGDVVKLDWLPEA